VYSNHNIRSPACAMCSIMLPTQWVFLFSLCSDVFAPAEGLNRQLQQREHGRADELTGELELVETTPTRTQHELEVREVLAHDSIRERGGGSKNNEGKAP